MKHGNRKNAIIGIRLDSKSSGRNSLGGSSPSSSAIIFVFSVLMVLTLFLAFMSDLLFSYRLAQLEKRPLNYIHGMPDVEKIYIGMGNFCETNKNIFVYTDSLMTCAALFVDCGDRQKMLHVTADQLDSEIEPFLFGAKNIYVIGGSYNKSFAMKNLVSAIFHSGLEKKTQYAVIDVNDLIGIYDGKLYVDKKVVAWK